MYLAQENGICIGTISLDEEQEAAYQQLWAGSEPALVVHRLCVTPNRQRQGVARQLMDFTEDLARQQGYAIFSLGCLHRQPRSRSPVPGKKLPGSRSGLFSATPTAFLLL